jgi:type VI secretion system protein ImpG
MTRDPRFLRYYDQELRFVRDLAGEFASEHARIADRFGLDQDNCADPHVEWLLDGFAFLAARVQQKLDGDYAVFTHHLLEMIYPGYISPTPSTGIVALTLAPDAPPLPEGFVVPRGTQLISRVVPGESSRCAFSTAHAVTVWPVDLVNARYLSPAALAATDPQRPPQTKAAVALRLRTLGGVPFAALSLESLVFHLGSRDHIAHLLYEAIVAHGIGVAGCAGSGREKARSLGGRELIARRGFNDDEAVFPPSPRGYSGYRLLQEYFTLPERFMFVRIGGLAPLVRTTAEEEIELFLLLDKFDPALDGVLAPTQFVLNATPVVNLLPRRAKPILLSPEEREYHVVGDRLRPFDYEVYAVSNATGYGSDEREVVRFRPFYETNAAAPQPGGAYYAVERRPRLLSEHEERSGTARSAYLGSEVYISLSDAAAKPLRHELKRLDVEVLCTNRDLPLRLPLPPDEMHFALEIGGPISGARVIGGLTRPAPSLAILDPPDGLPWGDTAWRLIGVLALNYHSIVDGPDERGADALRSLLELHAASAPPQIARQVEGVLGVTTRRVTRRLPDADAITFGRGLEITLELGESAFQSGSAFLLGSVLDTFFSRHVTINSFTETVLRTSERGELTRWPPRIGSRLLM